MEVLHERIVLAGKKGDPLPVKVLSVNFKKLRTVCTSEETSRFCHMLHILLLTHGYKQYDPVRLFHCVAGLYCQALPDMELEAVYGCLTASARTLLVMDEGIPMAPPTKIRSSGPTPTSAASVSRESDRNEEDEELNPYSLLYSSEESGDEEEENSGKSLEEELAQERESFLRVACQFGQRGERLPEERIAGSATYIRLSCKPQESCVQITLLAVRRRHRHNGIGSFLMQQCKDPALVGPYDALLAFADHKAETFFTRHSFNDDPIITAKYRSHVDNWENSTLMVYIPPFTTPSNCYSSLQSLLKLNEHIDKWRHLAIDGYCEQVCMMERLKQEVLALQARVDSQGAVIDALTQQLQGCQASRAQLEREFLQYRQNAKDLLHRTVQEQAQNWLATSEHEAQCSQDH